jgi:hypothetical protein
MTLKRREKILAGMVGALLVLVVGWFLFFSGDARPLTRLRNERDRLAAEVEKKQTQVETAAADSQRLAEWQRRALPSDRANARSLYQNWLRRLTDEAGFRQAKISSSEAESRRNTFDRFSFTVQGRASLDGMTRFLYDFYSAGHLQQIRLLDAKPIDNSTDLDVNMTIEAMSLPGADRKDQLSKEPRHGPPLAKRSLYSGPIVGRNLFAPYAAPTRTRERPSLDLARFMFVTAILEVDGRRQVWLFDRTSGRTWKLSDGESFHVGALSGQVKSVGPTEVIVDLDGQVRRLGHGDNLRAGTELSETRGE